MTGSGLDEVDPDGVDAEGWPDLIVPASSVALRRPVVGTPTPVPPRGGDAAGGRSWLGMAFTPAPARARHGEGSGPVRIRSG